MKKILVTTDFYIPAFKAGGPTRSILNLTKLLHDKFDIDILTSSVDIDAGKLDLSLINTDAKVNSWVQTDFSRVYYLSSLLVLISNFKKVLYSKDYDYIYLNSFFSFRFSILFVFLYFLGFFKSSKLIIAPRGELTPGAIKNKYFKKMFYLKLFNISKLIFRCSNLTFHFTSKEELFHSIQYLGLVDYKLAPNMHDDIPEFIEKQKDIGFLNVVFLSRISPKKNLLTICKAISNIKVGNVKFTIAGNVEDELYWESCLNILESSSDNIQFEYLGPLDRDAVWNCLSSNHVFVLPTYNENYGHSIVEGMISSNLALISDQTPWNDVSLHGSAVYAPEDIQSYEQFLNKAIKMNSQQFNLASKSTYLYCHNALMSNVDLVEEVFNV